MGWESRDWGQWTDEERDAYLDGRAPRQQITGAQLLERIDSPYSTGISARVKVWGGLFAAIALFALFMTYERTTLPTLNADEMPALRPPTVYGWTNVPPINPVFVNPDLAGKPTLCTGRERFRGRWVCLAYTAIRAGQQAIVLPPSSPLHTVACNDHPQARCPGGAV